MIIADFKREYDIDLMSALDEPGPMSWHNFSVLLTGLSPQSTLVNVMAEKKSGNKQDDPDLAREKLAEIWS